MIPCFAGMTGDRGFPVIPAKAGIRNTLKLTDSGVRRNDGEKSGVTSANHSENSGCKDFFRQFFSMTQMPVFRRKFWEIPCNAPFSEIYLPDMTEKTGSAAVCTVYGICSLP